VGKASITNLLPDGRAGRLSSSLGEELKRRRVAAHLSQGEVSAPLTRAYVSQVERGHTIPSLPALIVMAEKLGTTADEVLRAVNRTLNSEYPVRHEDRSASKPGR
jgi:transcriptional regulator with XRE-family HTH domain